VGTKNKNKPQLQLTYNIGELVHMLKYMRKAGSATHKLFNDKYLHPVFGNPDGNGNYIIQVGNRTDIVFTAHHDTVHTKGGMQTVEVVGNKVGLPTQSMSNCLGADCTTGIWLILNMIAHKVSGIYIIHADEESGCIGSKALVKSKPQWLDQVDTVISFDRYGTNSVITYQSGFRTCSDEFGKSLSRILGMGHELDDGGSYTDSNAYKDVVPECTNLSVGYYSQHTNREHQNLTYAEDLCKKLIKADWDKLVISRDPNVTDSLYYYGYGNRSYDYWGDYWSNTNTGKHHRLKDEKDDYTELLQSIKNHPQDWADMLLASGITHNDLVDWVAGVYNDDGFWDY